MADPFSPNEVDHEPNDITGLTGSWNATPITGLRIADEKGRPHVFGIGVGVAPKIPLHPGADGFWDPDLIAAVRSSERAMRLVWRRKAASTTTIVFERKSNADKWSALGQFVEHMSRVLRAPAASSAVSASPLSISHKKAQAQKLANEVFKSSKHSKLQYTPTAAIGSARSAQMLKAAAATPATATSLSSNSSRSTVTSKTTDQFLAEDPNTSMGRTTPKEIKGHDNKYLNAMAENGALTALTKRHTGSASTSGSTGASDNGVTWGDRAKTASFYGSAHNNSDQKTSDFFNQKYSPAPASSLYQSKLSWGNSYSSLGSSSYSSSYSSSRSTTSGGIANIGNTCYLNAILQALLGLPCFVADLNAEAIIGARSALTLPQSTFYMCLVAIAHQLQTGDREAINVRGLKEAIGVKYKRFAGYSQQDAHEFLSECLNVLHDDIVDSIPKSLLPPPPPATAAAACAAAAATATTAAVTIDKSDVKAAPGPCGSSDSSTAAPRPGPIAPKTAAANSAASAIAVDSDEDTAPSAKPLPPTVPAAKAPITLTLTAGAAATAAADAARRASNKRKTVDDAGTAARALSPPISVSPTASAAASSSRTQPIHSPVNDDVVPNSPIPDSPPGVDGLADYTAAMDDSSVPSASTASSSSSSAAAASDSKSKGVARASGRKPPPTAAQREEELARRKVAHEISPVSRNFHGEVSLTITCTKCNLTRTTKEPFLNVSLDFPELNQPASSSPPPHARSSITATPPKAATAPPATPSCSVSTAVATKPPAVGAVNSTAPVAASTASPAKSNHANKENTPLLNSTSKSGPGPAGPKPPPPAADSGPRAPKPEAAPSSDAKRSVDLTDDEPRRKRLRRMEPPAAACATKHGGPPHNPKNVVIDANFDTRHKYETLDRVYCLIHDVVCKKSTSNSPTNPSRWYWKCPQHDQHKCTFVWDDEHRTSWGDTSAAASWTAPAEIEGLTLADLVRSYFDARTVAGYNCSACKHDEVRVQPQWSVLPRVLILHLKRFSPNMRTGTYTKRNDRVAITNTLTFTAAEITRDVVLPPPLHSPVSVTMASAPPPSPCVVAPAAAAAAAAATAASANSVRSSAAGASSRPATTGVTAATRPAALTATASRESVPVVPRSTPPKARTNSVSDEPDWVTKQTMEFAQQSNPPDSIDDLASDYNYDDDDGAGVLPSVLRRRQLKELTSGPGRAAVNAIVDVDAEDDDPDLKRVLRESKAEADAAAHRERGPVGPRGPKPEATPPRTGPRPPPAASNDGDADLERAVAASKAQYEEEQKRTAAAASSSVANITYNYRLRSVVHHKGTLAYAGHYTTDIFTPTAAPAPPTAAASASSASSTSAAAAAAAAAKPSYNKLFLSPAPSSSSSGTPAAAAPGWKRYDDSLVTKITPSEATGTDAQRQGYIFFFLLDQSR